MPSPTSKTGKITSFPPCSHVNAGDVILAPTDTSLTGWWVVVKSHVTGTGTGPANLKPGQSNDFYHWSNG